MITKDKTDKETSDISLTNLNEILDKKLSLFSDFFNLPINLTTGFSKYLQDFYIPFLISAHTFNRAESENLFSSSLEENATAYMHFFKLNSDLFFKTINGSMDAAFNTFLGNLTNKITQWNAMSLNSDPCELFDQFSQSVSITSNALQFLAKDYPKAMLDIKSEFGFHFNDGSLEKVAETERYNLYQVLPTEKDIKTKKHGKPILVIPPYVLGSDILSFLPRENKSYVHAFANQGIPVYIRITKDIAVTPALQTMKMEDDTIDTKILCEIIQNRHGKSVTLNGYCQGGFTSLCSLLSGELDHVVDAFITCVSPIDGTRSKRLADFLKSLSSRFNHLNYGRKILPNGNVVADGDLLAWVYKLSSIEKESPVATFYRDFMMFASQKTAQIKISNTAAALNCWLAYDRTDIPFEIAQQSFISYNQPISDDGTLPVRLFDRPLNIKRIQEKKIPWLICYGEGDDLVEKASALAPLDYIDTEVTPFPKGHVAIATSWSNPVSKCALHTRFGKNNARGPVRFQLDLDQEEHSSKKP